MTHCATVVTCIKADMPESIQVTTYPKQAKGDLAVVMCGGVEYYIPEDSDVVFNESTRVMQTYDGWLYVRCKIKVDDCWITTTAQCPKK